MKSGHVSIVIDPRRTELARYATYHLALRPGTNVAVLNMMFYYIISEGLEDKKFIEERTEGFEAFRREILNIDLDRMEKVSGVDRHLVREAAMAYASAPNAMSFHGLGVTEHSQGTFTVIQIADLALINRKYREKRSWSESVARAEQCSGKCRYGCSTPSGCRISGCYG